MNKIQSLTSHIQHSYIPNNAIAKFDKSANVVDGGIDIASVLDVTGWNSVMLISLIVVVFLIVVLCRSGMLCVVVCDCFVSFWIKKERKA